MRRIKKLYTAIIHYNDDVELDVRRALSLDKFEIVSKEIENGLTKLTSLTFPATITELHADSFTNSGLTIKIWAPNTSVGVVDRLYSIEGVNSVKAKQCEGK